MHDLKNPFTPSEIASRPETFFGRSVEIRILSRAIRQGSVAIQGTVGIGKSSLLSRTLMHMDGFSSDEDSVCIMAVGHSDIKTVDDAARLILEELIDIDEKQKKITIGFPKFAKYESSEVYKSFVSGRHLAALTKIVEDEAFKAALGETSFLIIAIDEADKCAPAIARLMRTVGTKIQLSGISNVRFVLAGVSPFYERMIDEDEGVVRFIFKTISLSILDDEDAEELLESKFKILANQIREDGLSVFIDPEIIDRILLLSGGHPHLLQLLGSHVVEHECVDPDGAIDGKDLVDSLQTICFESRGPVYDRVKHMMRLEGKEQAFTSFLKLIGGKFPGRVAIDVALTEIEQEDLKWLISHDIISAVDDDTYGIVDEFLRVRYIIDAEQQSVVDLEEQLIEKGELMNFDDQFESGNIGTSVPRLL